MGHAGLAKNLTERDLKAFCFEMLQVTLRSHTWVGLTIILVIQLLWPFLTGRGEFGRIVWVTLKDVGITKPKSTQPKCATSRVTLYTSSYHVEVQNTQ